LVGLQDTVNPRSMSVSLDGRIVSLVYEESLHIIDIHTGANGRMEGGHDFVSFVGNTDLICCSIASSSRQERDISRYRLVLPA
jgi:hypothetical protein